MRCFFVSYLFLLVCLTAQANERSGKLALVQYHVDAHFAEGEKNLEALTKYAEEAVRNQANLVLFPESSIFGYDSGTEIWCKPGMKKYKLENGEWRNCRNVATIAEPIPHGKLTQYWRTFAMSHKVYIIFSLVECTNCTTDIKWRRFYNTIVAASPEGKIVTYRKRVLYEIERAYATKGTEPTVLPTPFGTFGLMICIDGMDTKYIEGEEDFNFGFYDEYKRLQVDAILNAMNWADQDPESPWAAQNVFVARAREHAMTIFIADAWDGTGKYSPDSNRRIDQSSWTTTCPVGQEGISYHSIQSHNYVPTN